MSPDLKSLIKLATNPC